MNNPAEEESYTLAEVALHMRRVLNEVIGLYGTSNLLGRMATAVVGQYDAWVEEHPDMTTEGQ